MIASHKSVVSWEDMRLQAITVANDAALEVLDGACAAWRRGLEGFDLWSSPSIAEEIAHGMGCNHLDILEG